MFANNKKYFSGLILLVGIVLLFAGVITNERAIDEDIRKEIEAQIPVCQKKDEFAKTIKQSEPGVYVASEIDEYSKLREACHKEFVKKYRQRD